MNIYNNSHINYSCTLAYIFKSLILLLKQPCKTGRE